jgi:glycosyltransferase involved in cell wall biosynthesis
MKLIASAIVRNEADRYLDMWLTHLTTFCDEVRLLDDGSTDETWDIAAEHPNVHIARNDGPGFFQDESRARNRLLDWTMEGQPTYVLAIDADEFIGDTVALRATMTMNQAPVFAITMREVWQVGTVDPGGMQAVGLRVDGLWGDRRCPILWQAPPKLSGASWRIPHRKLACGREPQRVRGQRGFDSGVGVYHFGWTRVAEREARAERYYEHDGGRFHANAHLQSLLDPDEAVTLDWQPWPTSIPGTAAERASRP